MAETKDLIEASTLLPNLTDENGQLMKILYGAIDKKKETNGKITLSGYVSTSALDYDNEVILPSAFEKHLQPFKDNAIYCYNHKRDIPIGRINKMHIDDFGLYFDEVVLSNTELVEKYLGPLILDGVLTQQSIGAEPVKYVKLKGGIVQYTEVKPREGSLVSIAANPTAVLDSAVLKTYKGFQAFDSVDEFIDAYEKGEISIPKSFYFAEHYKEKNMTISDLSPDFRDVEVLKPTDKELIKYDDSPDTKVKDSPEELLSCIFLAKSQKLNKLLFKVGDVTDKGYRLNWDAVALNLGRLFGAKGEYLMDAETRKALVDRLMLSYKMLGKKLPEYNGMRLSDLDEASIDKIKYYEITFFENEKEVIINKVLENDLKNAKTIIDKAREDGKEFNEEVETLIKSFYPTFSIGIHGEAWSDEDWSLLHKLITMLEEYRKPSGTMNYSLDEKETEVLKELKSCIEDAITKIEKIGTENEEVPNEELDNSLDSELKKFLNS